MKVPTPGIIKCPNLETKCYFKRHILVVIYCFYFDKRKLFLHFLDVVMTEIMDASENATS